MTRRFTLAVTLVLISVLLSGQMASARRQPPSVVHVSAERFTFTPSEITTRIGVPLEIRLTSEDTDHGFRILDTDTNVAIPKRGRGEVVVTFEPTAPGRYTFECSHVCGAGHSFMRGEIVVSE